MAIESLGQKEGTVVSIKKSEYQGEHKKDKNGNYKQIVELDNGDKGTCSTKDAEGTAWAVGTKVKYELKKWTNDEGTQSSMFLSMVRDNNNPYSRSFGGKAKGAKEYKAEAVSVAAKIAVDLVIYDKITLAEFKNNFQNILSGIKAEIDKVYNAE